MYPVNPEAIAVVGLTVTVVCFGLEQLGVGLKGADMRKVVKTLSWIAIFFGGLTQIFSGVTIYLFSLAGSHTVYLGTIFCFFGLFWVLAGTFFLCGGDKKVMAHFFACCLLLCVVFSIRAFQDGLVWPLGVDFILIDLLLLVLTIGWYTENATCTKIAGVCNLAIGFVSLFLLFPQLL
jgi:succinate-acetate transporter protein